MITGKVCPECDGVIWSASAWSEEIGGEAVDGIKCPHCGAFVPDDELDDLDEE